MNRNLPSVVCFGEVLWDMFPEGKKEGGAPMNVAVNLKKQGINSILVSRVGNDTLGRALEGFLKANWIDTSFLQIDPDHDTGTVEVKIDTNRNAKYNIVFPSAWDFIETDSNLEQAVSEAEYVVFGSVACRNSVTRSALLKILEKAKKKVFDINLRSPHYERELIEELLLKADIVKVNEEELQILDNWFFDSAYTEDVTAKKLREKFKIDQLIVTLGERGAMVSCGNEIFSQKGFNAEVEDTVGSGDAFLATFLARQIKGHSIQESLEFACATGAFVVSKKGANPPYDESQIIEFIKQQTYGGMTTKLAL